MEYEKLYAQMVEAAEQAIAAIERADYGQAKQILISAEQRCEAEYLEMEETSARQDALALRQFSANSYAPNAFPAGAFSVSKKSDHDRYRSAS